MSTINQKMGFKPRTRTRAATHSSNLVTNATCPKCPGRHVIERVIDGVSRRLCGFCGEIWTVESADAQ